MARTGCIGKGTDTFAPLGPFIVPKEFVPDPQKMPIKFTLSGKVMQDSNTDRMTHNVREMLSFASHILTLHPGDILAMGSPAGVGPRAGRDLEGRRHVRLHHRQHRHAGESGCRDGHFIARRRALSAMELANRRGAPMMERKRSVVGIAAVALAISAVALLPAQKGGGDEFGPYELVENWPQDPCGEGYQQGSVGGIFAESADRVLIFQRGCLPKLTAPITSQSLAPERNASGYDLSQTDPARQPRWDNVLYIVNRDGKKIDSWEQHNKLFVRPHKVLISPYDPEKHVWLVDDGAHAVYKFTNDGKKLVMQLGEVWRSGQRRQALRATDRHRMAA